MLTIACGVCGFFLKIDENLYVLIAFMVCDYVTGIIKGFHTKKLSSCVGFKGICHKATILILVGLMNLIDSYILKTDNILRSCVIFFYIANEGISIIENAEIIGLPVPEKIKKALAQLKEGD